MDRRGHRFGPKRRDPGDRERPIEPLLSLRARTISVDSYKNVKPRRDDSGNAVSVTVADLRLYEVGQKTPDSAAVRRLQADLKSESEIFLAVGLSRSFAEPGARVSTSLNSTTSTCSSRGP